MSSLTKLIQNITPINQSQAGLVRTQRLIATHYQGAAFSAQQKRYDMNDNQEVENRPTDNQPLSAALMQLSESEIAQLLNTIRWLQADLIKLIPLFNGKEPVETVTYTQDLLSILSDQIGQVLAIKRAEAVQDYLQDLDNENLSIDYTAVHRLLNKMQGNQQRLVWTAIDD